MRSDTLFLANGSMLSRFRAIFAAISLAFILASCSSLMEGDTRSLQPIPAALVAEMKAKGMAPSDPILIRIYKQESELEVWKRTRSGRYALLKTYPICRWSGKLGPKRKSGDRQAPEGFYAVDAALLNPQSKYYLSFNLGYPNELERALGSTGEAMMVHGACSSSGCFALTDAGVAEIFAMARESLRGGQTAFQVQALPFRMTPANFAAHRNDPNVAFWKNLKEGTDIFEVTGREPKVAVCGRKYVFDAAVNPADGPLDPLASCPPLQQAVDPAVIAKRNSDEAMIASLVMDAATPAPALSYVDGGMHPDFRRVLQQSGAARLAKTTSLTSVQVSRPDAALADPYEVTGSVSR